MDKAFKDSLWMDCLFELYERNKKAGKEHINFSEVDGLVVEKSKIITNYEIDTVASDLA